jgi:AcrR family transcriptional regulator
LTQKLNQFIFSVNNLSDGGGDAMTGMRERQKHERGARILNAATALFRNQGFEAAHIDQIAEIAGVSVGTLYNYHRNKGDLLMAIVAIEVADVLEAGEALIANPPHSVEAALNALVFSYYDHSLVYLDKAMWRHAIAIATTQPSGPSGAAYGALDRALADQVTAMVRRLQAMGLVRADVGAGAVGEIAFNNLDRMFLSFVRSDDMDLPRLRAEVGAQHRALALILGG